MTVSKERKEGMKLVIEKSEAIQIAIKEVANWLDEYGIRYKYLLPSQLKIGVVNFWPSTGTITVDGELQKRPVKGIIGLCSVMEELGIRRRR